MNFREYLLSIHACKSARKWVNNKTSTEAWEQCENVNWLVWWLNNSKINIPIDIWVKFAKNCADIVAPLVNSSAASAAYYAASAASAAYYAASAASAAYYAASAAAYYAAYSAAAYSAAYCAGNAAYAAYYAASVADTDKYKIELLTLVRTTFQQPWKES